jgi:hypothetical protein
MDMNALEHGASERVQRVPRNVVLMIDEPGPPAGHLQILIKRTRPCSRRFPPHCSQLP